MSATFRLPDGRNLGYAVHGPEGAPPVLYCHGWPSSRLEASLLRDPPVRLIAADRPGYGLSAPNPDATLRGHAADIGHLVAHLGLERFAVAGVSGGGPLAAALAAVLPGKVAALGLINAVPPLSAPVWEAGKLRWLLRVAGMGPLAPPLLVTLRQFLFTPAAAATVFGEHLPEADHAVLTPQVKGLIMDSVREGLRTTSLGALTDARHFARDWGFPLAAIGCRTLIWQGMSDTLIPAEASRAFLGIPGARLDLRAGEGHYSLPLREGAAFLAALAASAG